MSVRERRTRPGKGARRGTGSALAPVQWHDPRWDDGSGHGGGGARIVHQVPGRVRIRFDGIDDTEFFESLHELLSGLPGVTSVRVNAAASSAVVRYDPEQHPPVAGLGSNPALKKLLDDSGVSTDDVMTAQQLVERGITYLEPHSQLAEAIVTAAERFDTSLRRASDGYLDLKVLFPITMAAFSTLHKARSKGTPMWMTLCTFAFNTFMSLHRQRLDSPSAQRLARSTFPAR